MDSLVGLIDQVIPGSPVLAIATAVILLAAGYIGRRVARSMQRQGARLGAVEKVLELEVTRRRQVEQCLREHGIEVPYWPADPPELYLVGPRGRDHYVDRYDDEDQVDERPETTELQTQYFTPPPPHRRRTAQ